MILVWMMMMMTTRQPVHSARLHSTLHFAASDHHNAEQTFIVVMMDDNDDADDLSCDNDLPTTTMIFRFDMRGSCPSSEPHRHSSSSRAVTVDHKMTPHGFSRLSTNCPTVQPSTDHQDNGVTGMKNSPARTSLVGQLDSLAPWRRWRWRWWKGWRWEEKSW